MLFGSTDSDSVHFLEPFPKRVSALITPERLTLVSVELGNPGDLTIRLSFPVLDTLELMDCHGVENVF
jgi:hypothetical protein